MTKKTKRRIAVCGIYALVILLSAVLVFSGVFGSGHNATTTNAASTSTSTTKLSMVEMNNSFDKMIIKATTNKTIVYVDKLYFDYSPMSTNRLKVTQNEETDYVLIDLVNSSGEWAKTWGYVRQEKGIRPDDPLMREVELTYLEINQYWEWRNFTNEENWSVSVNDGYKTVSFSFDLNSGNDGAVYFIDGVYALPEHYYPQIVYWWYMTPENPELLNVREQALEQIFEQAASTPEDEPLRLSPIKCENQTKSATASTNGFSGTGTMSNLAQNSTNDNAKFDNVLIGTIIFLGGLFLYGVAAGGAVAKSQQKYVPSATDTFGGYTPDTPPAPTTEQEKEYEENMPDLTEEQKAELEKRKEFSLDGDVPTGQKLVKLKVKDADGIMQDVYDENGSEAYVNRKTYTVGNQTYAIINRKNNLLIRWFPSTLELKDIAGNKITVNVDNKLMNMDGVEPYSPISRDDILNKLAAMGKYTSAINPDRMLYRMDDDQTLIKAMNVKINNINKNLWDTIVSAIKNLFGGDGSKGFLSNLLDVLIFIGVCVVGFLAAAIVFKFTWRFAFKE